MRGKKLLVLLFCMASVIQLVPTAFAETEGFSVYAPCEIALSMGADGTVTASPENPAIYNGMKTRAAAVTSIRVTAKDGWTLVSFSENFSDGEDSRLIGVSLNGEDIGANGFLDLSEQPWVIEADGKLPLDLRVNVPSGLPREDIQRNSVTA